MSRRFRGKYVWVLLPFLFCFPLSEAESQDLSFLADTTQYLWPTSASPYLSSTFGETRSRHLHAGIDIRTWGREGYPVYATRDGTVHRLLIGPHGYGKAVYLQHKDGSYSIYAHLNRFEDSLMVIADSIRMQGYHFLLDHQMDQKNIRVRQGELIGYTGSTGVGPPHLHFELRTPDNAAFNPLLTNIRVDDDIPPTFTSLAVEHLDPDGFHRTDIETVPAGRQGSKTHFGEILANGPVGLSVRVHDRANRTPNFYAVYSLSLVHEQDTLFHSSADVFQYRDASQMFIDRVFTLLKKNRQGYQRLFTVNGNRLPFYTLSVTRGVVDLPEGVHELEIIARDIYGNSSSAFLTLNVNQRTRPPAGTISGIPAYPKKSDFSKAPPGFHALELKRKPFESVGLTENSNKDLLNPKSDQNRPSIYFASDRATVQSAKKLKPGRRQILPLPDQTVWLDVPADGLFDTLHVKMEYRHESGMPVIRFLPDEIPLKSSATLNLIYPSDPGLANVAIGAYSYNRHRDRHHFLGPVQPGKLNRIRLHELSEIHLLPDRHPPWVGQARIEKNLAGFYVVHVPVVDEMSGIDFLRSSVLVNEERGITEYDPDKNKLTYYNPSFVPESRNVVEIIVYDGAGNRNTRTFQLSY